MKRRTRSERQGTARKAGLRELAPVLVFAAVVVLGPLLFGAVDRAVQVGLVALLAAGLFIYPPAPVALSRWGKVLVIALAVILVGKEFLPHGWFGDARWRRELAGEFGVVFPWSHHPEPARALDALLAVVVAALWFQWVRTLAAERGRRAWLAWTLAGAGAFIAVVCFTMGKGGESRAIFGLRYTEGWVGWGPFPNRNHTSSFLAMGALMSAGCAAWALAKQRWRAAAVAAVAFAITVAALLAGKSRGALVAFGAGLFVFLALVVIKRRERRTLLIAGGALVAVLALVAIFGGDVLRRFQSQEAGAVSNQMRVVIWKEALGIWRDAPLLGHGQETFAGVFPIYQSANFDGQTVLHPESSWLLWLCELGALPFALLASALAWFVFVNLRAAFSRHSGFFLTAGAFAGAVVLLAHAAIDVPAHRWATAGFALALLAVAFPLRAAQSGASPRVAVLAAVVAVFWGLPMLGHGPAWSPVVPGNLIAREDPPPKSKSRPRRPTLEEWESAAGYFPLNASLHQYAGLRALEAPPARWDWHFAIARRLAGSVWWYPAMQAMAVGQNSPERAVPLWQDAIDRAGRESAEVLRQAVLGTARARSFHLLWGPFIEERPALALAYARAAVEELREPPGDVRGFFDLWWERRALSAELTEREFEDFYAYAGRWCAPGQFDEWMRAHAARLPRDFRQWMRLLHGWKNDRRAWEVYALAVREPASSAAMPADATLEYLEARHRASPENPAHALNLAQFLSARGEKAAAERVITEAASRTDAAPAFLRSAAFLLAAQGNFHTAVETALREK